MTCSARRVTSAQSTRASRPKISANSIMASRASDESAFSMDQSRTVVPKRSASSRSGVARTAAWHRPTAAVRVDRSTSLASCLINSDATGTSDARVTALLATVCARSNSSTEVGVRSPDHPAAGALKVRLIAFASSRSTAIPTSGRVSIIRNSVDHWSKNTADEITRSRVARSDSR